MGFSARLFVAEDYAVAAVGGAQTDAQAQHGAADAPASAAFNHTACSVGLFAPDAVAACG